MQNQNPDQQCQHCFLIISSAIEELKRISDNSPEFWRINKIHSQLLSLLPTLPASNPRQDEIDHRIKELDQKVIRLASEVDALRTLQKRIRNNKVEEFVEVKYNGLDIADTPHLTEEEKKRALISLILLREMELKSPKSSQKEKIEDIKGKINKTFPPLRKG